MLPYRDSRLTQIALVLFFVIILGYAYFEGRGLLYGPRIEVPQTIQEVQDPFIYISGTAERIASLSMNGKPITVTADGKFNEPYLLSSGLNRIILDAKDKYGRTRQEVIQVVYKDDGSRILQPTGTTTIATSTSIMIFGTSTTSTTEAQ